MSCPLPIFDDLEALKEFSGARLAKATPHRLSMPPTSNTAPYIEDYRYVLDWLIQNQKSTFDSYRREVDRFMLWMWFVRPSENAGERIPARFSDLRRSDIEDYISFWSKPPMSWRATEVKRRFIYVGGERTPNPEWRPFVCKVSKQATRQAKIVTGLSPAAQERVDEAARPDKSKYSPSANSLKIVYAALSSLFTSLLNDEYVERNPVAQISSKGKKATHSTKEAISAERASKRLSKVQVKACMQAIEARQEELGSIQYERSLFMITCLIGMYLRISEVAAPANEKRQPTHGSFSYMSHEVDGQKIKSWWFSAIGKGNKLRKIPVSEGVLTALKRYRVSLGLPATPNNESDIPLFPKAKGQGGLTSTRHVRSILQDVFDGAYQILIDSGDNEEASSLLRCTVHWLRHTGISEDVKVRPMHHVQVSAGHDSTDTTKIYVENDALDQFESARDSELWVSITS